MKVCWILIFGLLPTFAGAADIEREALAMLEKMASASHTVNYSGTFVFNHSGQSESSRIAHFVNPAGGVMERLETLDGPAREVIRTNDQVSCYLPGTKTVLVDPRGSSQFPLRLEQIQNLAKYYRIVKESRDRVAGFDCQWVALLPRDSLRYARRFCAELQTGLPLSSRTFNEKNQTMEAFSFSTLRIGGGFNRELVKSKYAALSQKQQWRIDRSAMTAADAGDSGWVVNSPPAGFTKLMELRRSMPGKTGNMSHLVFSDGLAAISVFIEPGVRQDKKHTLRHQGAVNIYMRPVGAYTVTVLGETPAETVVQLARSLEPKSGTAVQR